MLARPVSISCPNGVRLVRHGVAVIGYTHVVSRSFSKVVVVTLVVGCYVAWCVVVGGVGRWGGGGPGSRHLPGGRGEVIDSPQNTYFKLELFKSCMHITLPVDRRNGVGCGWGWWLAGPWQSLRSGVIWSSWRALERVRDNPAGE